MQIKKIKSNFSKMVRAKGIAMVMFLITLPVILGFIAFVIDIGRAQVAREQSSALARLLALSAIEQFNDIESVENKNYENPPTLMEKFTSAKERINAIAGRHHLITNADEQFCELIYPWETTATCEGKDGGKIYPGNYYFSQPDENTNPCPNSEYPCFVNATSGTSTPNENLTFNAFKLDVTFVEKLKTSFSKAAFGIFFINPGRVSATAMFVPRHLVFIVDKSLSTTASTHKYQATAGQKGTSATLPAYRGGYYAMALNQTTTSGESKLTASNYNNLTQLDAICAGTANAVNDLNEACQWRHLRYFDQINQNYNSNTGGLSSDSAVAFSNNHYKPGLNYYDEYDVVSSYGEDYAFKSFHPSTTDANYSAPQPDYLIQRELRNDSNTENYPQPLKSIFDGLYDSLKRFQRRYNSGDKVSVIFFDTQRSWRQTVPLTENIDYLVSLSNIKDESDAPRSPLTLPERFERIKKLGLFPGQKKHTNILMAVAEATEFLLRDPIRKELNAPTSDAIIYIGDFMPNCVAYGTASDPVAEFNNNCSATKCDVVCLPNDNPGLCGDSSCNSACGTATGTIPFSCNNTFLQFDRSVQQLSTYAAKKLYANQISLNVILLGQHAGPHTVDLAVTNGGECLSDAEARAIAGDYVKGGDSAGLSLDKGAAAWNGMNSPANNAFAAASETNPFYQAAKEAYNLVRMTGGVYIPILKGSEDPNCSNEESLESYCRASSGYVAAPPTNQSPKTSPHRRMYDRSCRSQEDQIADAFNEIVKSDTPFKIVETN